MDIKNAAEEVAQLVIKGYEKGILTESEAGSMLDALSPINESVLFEADENNEEPNSEKAGLKKKIAGLVHAVSTIGKNAKREIKNWKVDREINLNADKTFNRVNEELQDKLEKAIKELDKQREEDIKFVKKLVNNPNVPLDYAKQEYQNMEQRNAERAQIGEALKRGFEQARNQYKYQAQAASAQELDQKKNAEIRDALSKRIGLADGMKKIARNQADFIDVGKLFDLSQMKMKATDNIYKKAIKRAAERYGIH